MWRSTVLHGDRVGSGTYVPAGNVPTRVPGNVPGNVEVRSGNAFPGTLIVFLGGDKF